MCFWVFLYACRYKKQRVIYDYEYNRITANKNSNILSNTFKCAFLKYLSIVMIVINAFFSYRFCNVCTFLVSDVPYCIECIELYWIITVVDTRYYNSKYYFYYSCSILLKLNTVIFLVEFWLMDDSSIYKSMA